METLRDCPVKFRCKLRGTFIGLSNTLVLPWQRCCPEFSNLWNECFDNRSETGRLSLPRCLSKQRVRTQVPPKLQNHMHLLLLDFGIVGVARLVTTIYNCFQILSTIWHCLQFFATKLQRFYHQFASMFNYFNHWFQQILEVTKGSPQFTLNKLGGEYAVAFKLAHDSRRLKQGYKVQQWTCAKKRVSEWRHNQDSQSGDCCCVLFI